MVEYISVYTCYSDQSHTCDCIKKCYFVADRVDTGSGGVCCVCPPALLHHPHQLPWHQQAQPGGVRVLHHLPQGER